MSDGLKSPLLVVAASSHFEECYPRLEAGFGDYGHKGFEERRCDFPALWFLRLSVWKSGNV